MTKPEIIIRLPVTHKRAFFGLNPVMQHIRQMRRSRVMRIAHTEQIILKGKLKDAMPETAVDQIRQAGFLVGDKGRVDRVGHAIWIEMRVRAVLRVDQRAVVCPVRMVDIGCTRDANSAIATSPMADCVEAVERPVPVDRCGRPWSGAVLFFDDAVPIQDGADSGPGPIDVCGFEVGKVDAAFEEVVAVVLGDDVGVVDCDVAGVWQGVFGCVWEVLLSWFVLFASLG